MRWGAESIEELEKRARNFLDINTEINFRELEIREQYKHNGKLFTHQCMGKAQFSTDPRLEQHATVADARKVVNDRLFDYIYGALFEYLLNKKGQ